MEIIITGIILIISFLVTFLATKFWIKTAIKAKLLGKDMNKYTKPKVAESGGIVIVTIFCFGVLLYIFLKIFYLQTEVHLIETFALLTSVLLAGFLGFTDDILGWKIGLRQYQKLLLTIPIAIPIIVINPGQSIMTIPLIGSINFGLLFPLLIIPIGIIGASNAFNLLAGFNGLEAGMGAVILFSLGTFAFIAGLTWLTLISFLAVTCLLGFLIFNKYPAKIFPGDSLTYGIGALIAITAILGNIEKFAVFIFTPFILEFFLKARSKFRAETFGIPQKNGTLKAPYKKIYSLTHLMMKIGIKKEKNITISLILIEVIICLIGFWLFLRI